MISVLVARLVRSDGSGGGRRWISLCRWSPSKRKRRGEGAAVVIPPHSSVQHVRLQQRRLLGSVVPLFLDEKCNCISSHLGAMDRRKSGIVAFSSRSANDGGTEDSAHDSIIVTKACADRLMYLSSLRPAPILLRLVVDSGGCSGFQYTFTLEEGEPNHDDRVFEQHSCRVVVDETSFELLKGATVDFESGVMRSSFTIVNNPNSENACGCGSSFAVKAFSSNPAID